MRKQFLYTIVSVLVGLVIFHIGYNQIWQAKFPYQPLPFASSKAEIELLLYFLFSWPALLLLVTIIGVFLNLLFVELITIQSSGKKLVKPREFLTNIAFGVRTWIAIVVAPFVLIITFLSVREIPDNWVALFYAFQNGFFWQSVFGAFRQRAESSLTVHNSEKQR